MKPKILIIDDEPDICKALRYLLEREEYSVTCTYSGEEGIEAFRKDWFDVVLTDLKMGRVDGMAVLEKIKEISHEMPVIIMTAFRFDRVRGRGDETRRYRLHNQAISLNEEIRLTVSRIIEQKKIIGRIMRENTALKQQISQRMACRDFVANLRCYDQDYRKLSKKSSLRRAIYLFSATAHRQGTIGLN